MSQPPPRMHTNAGVPLNRIIARLFWPWRGRLAFFAACVALGVGSLFAVGNLLGLVQNHLHANAREMTGGDLRLSSWQPLSDEAKGAVDEALSTWQAPTESIQMLEMASMVKGGAKEARPFLVTIRAVDPLYPLIGDLETEPADALARMHRDGGCLLGVDAAKQHGLAPGDTLALGETTLPLVGLVVSAPDRGLSGSLAFAPRILLPRTVLPETGLLKFGSRVRTILLARLEGSGAERAGALAELRDDLEAKIADHHVNVQTYTAGQPSTRELFNRIGIFFAMVGLVTLVLGVIGVVVGVLAMLHEQIQDIATLRCMGVSPTGIRRATLWLCGLVGLVGGAAGVGLGLGLDALLLTTVRSMTGLEIDLGISWFQVAQSLVLGVVVGLGFNLASVQALGRVSPRAILADSSISLRLRRRDSVLLVTAGTLVVFGYLALSSGSIPMALAFSGSLLGACVLTLGLVWLGHRAVRQVERALRRSTRASSARLTIRHGLLQVLRNQERSLVYLLTLGLGLSLVSTLAIVQNSLQEALELDGQDLPNLFLVDVQPDQVQTVVDASEESGGDAPNLSPLIRARLSHINGEPITKDDLEGDSPEARTRARFLTREYSLTYRDTLSRSETVTDGTYWSPGEGGDQVSLEIRFAKRIGVGMGDTLRFDVQGRPVEVRVTSLRKINWLSLMPNFFVVLPEQRLRDAPQTLVGSVQLPSEATVGFKDTLFSHHPNISAIDLPPIFEQVQGLFNTLGVTIRVLALLCALVGLMILFATLQLGRPERIERGAVLRTLGFQRGGILRVELVEVATIGAIASVIVLFISLGLGWALTDAMDLDLRVPLITVAAATLAPVALTILSGVTNVLPSTRREPAG